jgi:hypothetical protein
MQVAFELKKTLTEVESMSVTEFARWGAFIQLRNEAIKAAYDKANRK